MIDRLTDWLRWVLLVPGSIGTAFLVASLISFVARGVFTYPAAFLSGCAYVFAALYTASRVAPSHRRIVIAVLGVLILGDLTFVHLVLPPDMINAASTDGGLSVLLGLLRADDFRDLRHGGAVKIVGALAGLVLAWRITSGATKRGATP